MNRGEAGRALDALRRIVQALRVASRASEREAGLSTAQVFVLQHIAEAGPCSVSEVAEATLTHPSSVSVVVSRLVAQGWVTRQDAPEDRRRSELAVTEAGRARLAAAPVQPQARMIATLAAMEPAELAALAAGLDRLAAGLAPGEAPAPMFFAEEEARSTGTAARSTGTAARSTGTAALSTGTAP